MNYRQHVYPAIFSATVIFFTLLMMLITIPYLSFKTDILFLLTKQHLLHKKVWLWSFYLHICSSPFILLAGAIQFSEYIRKNYIQLHRAAGKVYMNFILFVSAPSGLIMAVYANGGILAQVSFVILSSLWWYYTYQSWRAIRIHDIPAHRSFIIRSYALTLSAITLRTYIFFIRKYIPMDGVTLYVMVSWLSWIPNLLIAEGIIFFLKRKQNKESLR